MAEITKIQLKTKTSSDNIEYLWVALTVDAIKTDSYYKVRNTTRPVDNPNENITELTETNTWVRIDTGAGEYVIESDDKDATFKYSVNSISDGYTGTGPDALDYIDKIEYNSVPLSSLTLARGEPLLNTNDKHLYIGLNEAGSDPEAYTPLAGTSGTYDVKGVSAIEQEAVSATGVSSSIISQKFSDIKVPTTITNARPDVLQVKLQAETSVTSPISCTFYIKNGDKVYKRVDLVNNSPSAASITEIALPNGKFTLDVVSITEGLIDSLKCRVVPCGTSETTVEWTSTFYQSLDSSKNPNKTYYKLQDNMLVPITGSTFPGSTVIYEKTNYVISNSYSINSQNYQLQNRVYKTGNVKTLDGQTYYQYQFFDRKTFFKPVSNGSVWEWEPISSSDTSETVADAFLSWSNSFTYNENFPPETADGSDYTNLSKANGVSHVLINSKNNGVTQVNGQGQTIISCGDYLGTPIKEITNKTIGSNTQGTFTDEDKVDQEMTLGQLITYYKTDSTFPRLNFPYGDIIYGLAQINKDAGEEGEPVNEEWYPIPLVKVSNPVDGELYYCPTAESDKYEITVFNSQESDLTSEYYENPNIEDLDLLSLSASGFYNTDSVYLMSEQSVYAIAGTDNCVQEGNPSSFTFDNSKIHMATILDKSGNSSFPGQLTVPRLNCSQLVNIESLGGDLGASDYWALRSKGSGDDGYLELCLHDNCTEAFKIASYAGTYDGTPDHTVSFASGNIQASGNISAEGDISAAGITVAGSISAGEQITSKDITATGDISAAKNITLSNNFEISEYTGNSAHPKDSTRSLYKMFTSDNSTLAVGGSGRTIIGAGDALFNETDSSDIKSTWIEHDIAGNLKGSTAIATTANNDTLYLASEGAVEVLTYKETADAEGNITNFERKGRIRLLDQDGNSTFYGNIQAGGDIEANKGINFTKPLSGLYGQADIKSAIKLNDTATGNTYFPWIYQDKYSIGYNPGSSSDKIEPKLCIVHNSNTTNNVLTILDAKGNSIFPGTVSAKTFTTTGNITATGQLTAENFNNLFIHNSLDKVADSATFKSSISIMNRSNSNGSCAFGTDNIFRLCADDNGTFYAGGAGRTIIGAGDFLWRHTGEANPSVLESELAIKEIIHDNGSMDYNNDSVYLLAEGNVYVSSNVNNPHNTDSSKGDKYSGYVCTLLNHSGNSIFPGTVSAKTFTTTGNITASGTIEATGQLTAGAITSKANITATGQLTASAITSTGTIEATGQLTAGAITSKANITATGQLTASAITSTGTVTAKTFDANSDARLKENFQPLIPEKSILDLPTYKFDFIDGAKNQIGCKAQDLQEICPEIVHEGEDGYLSIQESKIVYLLLEEVKKLREEINQLRNK